MTLISRRELMRQSALILASHTLLRFGLATQAFAGPVKPILEPWVRDLYELCGDLKRHALTPLEWQSSIKALYDRISLTDLLAFIDFKRLVHGLALPEDHAAIREVRFPAVQGLPKRVGFTHKIFALRRGAAVIPHGHNNMVSAHLVLDGSFRVRTFHRHFQREGEGFLAIEPSRDEDFHRGDLLTMSDERDNIHWLTATSERAYTFDIPVLDLDPGKNYPTPANRYSMIFVDPLAERARDGLIRAPILTFEEALAKFGKS